MSEKNSFKDKSNIWNTELNVKQKCPLNVTPRSFGEQWVEEALGFLC